MKEKIVLALCGVLCMAGIMTAEVHATEVLKETPVEDFTYQVVDDEVIITKYVGEDTEVIIPDIIEGKKVTVIGAWAFADNNSITSVKLPENLEEIGANAFWWCNELQAPQIPETVTKIGNFAFAGSKFKELHIPKNVSSIGAKAFGSLYNLDSFTIDEENIYFEIYDGVLYNEEMTQLLICPSNKSSVDIPEGVVRIEDRAFSDCSRIVEIELPDSLESIGVYAFGDCHALKKIIIPANVKDVGSSPFGNCSQMTEIIVETGNTVYASVDGILYTKDLETLIRCPEAIPTVKISNKAKKIVMEAFFARRIADVIIVPENVEIIEGLAFSAADCTDFVILNKNCTLGGGGVFDRTEATIYGYKDSTTQEYAEKYELPFKYIEECPFMIFQDVAEDSWQFKGIKYVYDNNIMSGFTAAEFGTNEKLSREQFVQVLYNNSGKPAVNIENEFPDVKNAWYKNAVLWAKENGIANGQGDGTFGIGKNITRQDLAVMLYKYAKLKGYDLTATDGLIEQYADDNKVSGYAVDAMNWAITQGVITGKGKKGEDISTFNLDPAGTATRAECATMIMKLLEKNK